MKPGLLDVNFLIALIDPNHEFHESAHAWFQRNQHRGWATCPITQNACLRILGKPGYPFPGLTIEAVRDILSALTKVKGHLFWPDSYSMLEDNLFDLTEVRPAELTDLYLLGLAVRSEGRLITFDRKIRWQRLAGCTAAHIGIVGPASL